MCSLCIECVLSIACVASLSYHTCVRVVCVGKTNPTPPCARAHTDTSACSRAHTHTRACAPHTDPLQSSRNEMRRDRPHAHKSKSVLLYYLSSIHTSATHKYARAIRAHTHTHTHTHTRHGHTVSACMHSQRERATTSGVGTGLRHYSFSYSVFREEAPNSPRGNRPVSAALFIFLQFYFHRHTTG
jgi:hypothetical protein